MNIKKMNVMLNMNMKMKMKMVNRILLSKSMASVIVIVMLLTTQVAASNTNLTVKTPSVYTAKHTVTISGVSKQITVIWTNLKDPLIRVDNVVAGGGVGATAPLKTIVDSASDADGKGIAGVNGTFFNAYTDMQPQGTVVSDGSVKHIGNEGSLFTISSSNQAAVNRIAIKIEGSTNNQWTWPNNWYAWNINHFFAQPEAVMLFNRDYKGPKPKHDFVAIEVDKGIVRTIQKGTFNIPQDGFLVLAKEPAVVKVFQVGKPAAYRLIYRDEAGLSVDAQFAQYRTAVGAGPTLLKNGVIKADALKEGFAEGKITTNRAQRSMVGVTAKGMMGMVSVSNVTVKELAEVAKQLGMVDAINLDGGGSSAVYANGQYFGGPGRNISNALVVRVLKQTPINVVVNNKPMYFDVEPYKDAAKQVFMAPLRQMSEALGAKLNYDSVTKNYICVRYGTTVILPSAGLKYTVNGVSKDLTTAIVTKDGRAFAPVSLWKDAFGVTLTEDPAKNTISISSETLEMRIALAKSKLASGAVTEAIALFENVLALDPNHLATLKDLAEIHMKTLKNYALAAGYYERILRIDAGDYITSQSLAWAYYSLGSHADAVRSFERIVAMNPNESMGYYGLGLCYSRYGIDDKINATKYFRLALENGLSGEQKKWAEDYLK